MTGVAPEVHAVCIKHACYDLFKLFLTPNLEMSNSTFPIKIYCSINIDCNIFETHFSMKLFIMIKPTPMSYMEIFPRWI